MSEENPTAIHIKKYANRRLYDTVHSRYVNLSQIAELIKAGEIVMVVEASTGEDLTKVILTQIILEEEKGQRNLLPVDFLHELIKYGESASGDFLRSFLASGFEAYKQAQKQMSRTFQNWMPPVWPAAREPKTDQGVENLEKRLADLEARLNTRRERERD